MSQEDVRRSLEVLDSVLAEFDDCLDAWDALCDDPGGQDAMSELKEKLRNCSPTSSYDNQSTDGDTSHDSGLSLQEQVKFSSPPPIPKRSAKTKLSSSSFDFSRSSDSLDRDLSEPCSLSPKDSSDNGEVFASHYRPPPQCDNATAAGDMEERDVSSSPFSDRRRLFENLVSSQPPLERSFVGSSFKGRPVKDCGSEPPSLVYFAPQDADRADSSPSSFSTRATRVAPPRADGLLSLPAGQYHAPNCTCKERTLQLQQQFADTIRLVRAGKVKRLEDGPPDFVPPPPPPAKAASPKGGDRKGGLSKDSPKITAMSRSFKDLRSAGSPTSVSIEIGGGHHVEGVLDKKFSLSSDHLPLAETIEDLPKLLPTDALVRPHLGLSYSMEDDLSPGVKEILRTPPPRSPASLDSSRNIKSSSLSTFNFSTDSSLGYASSQSEHDTSLSPKKMDKVPVSTLKFSTLPEGVNLHSLPSYYGQRQSTEKGSNHKGMFRDWNFNHSSEPQLPPEPPKPKKGGIFRGFSRKIKKDKDKSNDMVRGKVS